MSTAAAQMQTRQGHSNKEVREKTALSRASYYRLKEKLTSAPQIAVSG
ncbi:hypothetical protein EV690_0967 [Celerinatantimonas diazotrophica]|uniref:Uncharacterized protein n=1 Tax=Celerinatantimonas diazotrophica TaxID=412034 RepID=A0A4R1K3Y5_9GAMM|nr:hypothetical protein EV690_0967 [Celerinatantimonas diazotrophica]CAG9297450.1 hypothetical protein CEDIAZO_02631 [Celerinatantimonas diazotrophica]